MTQARWADLERRQVPEGDNSVQVGSGQGGAVQADRERDDRAAMGRASACMEVAGGQVPDPHNRAYLVTKRQKAAIGRDRQGAERLRWARDRESLATCRQVPDSCRVIATGGGEGGPVA